MNDPKAKKSQRKKWCDTVDSDENGETWDEQPAQNSSWDVLSTPENRGFPEPRTDVPHLDLVLDSPLQAPPQQNLMQQGQPDHADYQQYLMMQGQRSGSTLSQASHFQRLKLAEILRLPGKSI